MTTDPTRSGEAHPYEVLNDAVKRARHDETRPLGERRITADSTAAPQPAPCWVHAGGDAGCRCFDEPPAPQPATPDQALDIDVIETRANAATPGPWSVIDPNEGSGIPPAWEVVNDAYLNPSGDDEPWISVELHVGVLADAEFIAHARADVPALIHALRQVAVERDMLQMAVDDWARTAGQDMRGLVRAAQDRPADGTETQ